MAEYSNLSATIDAQIRANGVQAITGPVLNAVLTAMVNVLGDGYRLNGVAVPADNPGSPDNRVAYLAAQDGTYTNFGGLTISGEVALLLWDSAWTKETLFSIDTAVTPGSGNLVTSGAVDDALTTLANNIAAAYMQLVPGATEGNLAEFDNAGQVRDAGLATSDLATKNGAFPNLFAGFAGNLVDTRSAGTRQGPFALRQSGGDGVNYMRKILGKTEAFNQLLPKNGFRTETKRGVTFTNNLDGSLTINGTATGGTAVAQYPFNFIVGHKYYIPSTNLTGIVFSANNSNSWNASGVGVFTATTQNIMALGVSEGVTANDVKVWPWFIDLTLLGLGDLTAAQFQSLHPLPYYAYNAGVLKNNAATGLETTGFNQWDEQTRGGYYDASGVFHPLTNQLCSTNLIPVFPSTTYYLNHSLPSVAFYDAGGNIIERRDSLPIGTFVTNANCYYIALNLGTTYGTTYNHDICINRSDASRNGIYEPYWKREIVLGLNNLACHDENNNAVVVNGLDGVGTAQDEAVVENGYITKIVKRFAEVNLGDLSWTYRGDLQTGRFATNDVPDYAFQEDIMAICSKYNTIINQPGTFVVEDKTVYFFFQSGLGSRALYVTDTAYSDAATFKAAMAGVKLRYELATPKVLTLDNPIPALIEVDNLGTEKRLPEDTADNPQGPFECDSNYSVSTANLVRLLNL